MIDGKDSMTTCDGNFKMRSVVVGDTKITKLKLSCSMTPRKQTGFKNNMNFLFSLDPGRVSFYS